MTVGKRRSRRPLAVFRCDGSAAIGGGHVRRCLTLAAALAEAGWARAFAVREETLAVIPGLAEAVDQVAVLDGPIEDEPARIAEAFGDAWDLLVVDHYRRDTRFETACRQWAERILVIDDLADRRHDADLLLDQTFGRKRSDYTQLVPAPLPGAGRVPLRAGAADVRHTSPRHPRPPGAGKAGVAHPRRRRGDGCRQRHRHRPRGDLRERPLRRGGRGPRRRGAASAGGLHPGGGDAATDPRSRRLREHRRTDGRPPTSPSAPAAPRRGSGAASACRRW